MPVALIIAGVELELPQIVQKLPATIEAAEQVERRVGCAQQHGVPVPTQDVSGRKNSRRQWAGVRG